MGAWINDAVPERIAARLREVARERPSRRRRTEQAADWYADADDAARAGPSSG